MISANQLGVYGAVADLCRKLSEDPRASGNLYERTFEQLSDDQKLSKVCSDPGLRTVERGQYFFTLDTEGPNEMEHLCREYALPRNEKKTRAKGWIRKKRRIGPVLDTKVCRHEDRYSVEVLIESLFQDRTASWVRIVSGIDKYVTEAMQNKEEEHRASMKPIAKTRPRQMPTVTLTSVSILVLEREWIDIETQRPHDHKCNEVSKAITRLLRHDESVKSTSPVTESHYKNGYVNYKNFIKTNEDINNDTKYTINNDTNNHNARDLHE